MNKKLFIILPLLLIILIAYFTNFKDKSETIIVNKFYEETLDDTETTSSDIIVHIAGCVQNPGIVAVPTGSRIIDVISSAGGATPDADFSKINLAYIVVDAQKIYIPSINDSSQELEYISNVAGENVIEKYNDFITININTASQSELESLPGVGPSTAIKIINYRKENGNFKKIDEIMNVPGIGESKFNSLKEYISVN